MRILIIDDERDILASTAELLQAMGHQVLTCAIAHQALGVMKAERPDVVLHDVRMPGLDLRAQLHAIRGDAATMKIPIILFTATLSAEELAKEVGANDGIEKPFDPDELSLMLKKWGP